MTIDYIEEVTKFNPYHGRDGRFTSASGGSTSGAGATRAGGRYKKEVEILLGSGKNFAGGITSVKTGKGDKGRDRARKIMEEAKTKAKGYGKDPRGLHLAINGLGEWSVDYIGSSGYFKSIDHIEHVQKFNPNHDERGRFTTSGGGAAVGAGAKVDNSPRGYKAAIRDYRRGYTSGRFGADRDPDYAKMQDDGKKLFNKWDGMIKQDPGTAKEHMKSEMASLDKRASNLTNKIANAYMKGQYDKADHYTHELKLVNNQRNVMGLIYDAAKFNKS